MTSDDQSSPDAYAEHPEESVFPGAGERVSDEDRQRALDAEPAGNATVGTVKLVDGTNLYITTTNGETVKPEG